MKKIHTIDEIRKVREEISRQCDYDPRKLIKFYMERQKKKCINKPVEQTH